MLVKKKDDTLPSLYLNTVLQKATFLFFKYEFDKCIEQKNNQIF